MPGSDDYVFDEDSGEWMPASELAAKRAAEGAVEVRDAVGNLLADGDQVTLIKDLEVKGAGRTQKQATLIKSIGLGTARRRGASPPGSPGRDRGCLARLREVPTRPCERRWWTRRVPRE